MDLVLLIITNNLSLKVRVVKLFGKFFNKNFQQKAETMLGSAAYIG